VQEVKGTTETPSAEEISQPVRPRVKEVTLDEPWQWLAAGWSDLLQAPRFSISYGFFFVLASYILTLGLVNGAFFFLIPPLAAGFFLVAPLLGIGLYGVSRSIELGKKVEFCQVQQAWQSNPVHISAMGLVLLMMLLVWMLMANLVFALFFDKPIPTWDNFIPVVFLSGDSPLFLFAGIFTGGVIALFTFAISVITVPLLIDRNIDVMTAMQTSLSATRLNWRPMLLWAALIAMFVGIGIITFYVGLLVTMPLVGHATWHAYRDLVAAEGESESV
jgi:uncharacterized membrane protein